MLLLQAELDFSRSTWALNPFCDIALEEALRLRDEKIVENVTVVSVGDNHTPEILLTGLSKGADRAIHIHAERPLRQLQIAKLLHQIVKKEHFDIILFDTAFPLTILIPVVFFHFLSPLLKIDFE